MSKPTSSLLINEHPLQVLPSLAVKIGLNEAIFVQQLHYWLKMTRHQREGRPWVYNAAADWKQQFPFWSLPTIRRVIASLRRQGLLLTTDKYNKMESDCTLWFTIEYDVLNALGEGDDQFDQPVVNVITPPDQNDHPPLINLITPPDQIDHRVTIDYTETTLPETTITSSSPVPGEATAPKHRKPDFSEKAQSPEHSAEPSLPPPSDAPPTPPASLAIPEKTPTAQQEIFQGLCEAMGYDYKTLAESDTKQIAQAGRMLREAGYSIGDIRRFMTEVWFKDWRWEKHQQHPTLKQIRTEIGKIHSVLAQVGPPVQKTGLEGYREMLKRQGITL